MPPLFQRNAWLFLLLVSGSFFAGLAAERPNIIFILCDDLGYGDVNCFNPQSRIRTPNMDRLAARGMKFTEAHSSSAVCTPTRYGLLTGRYNWRSRLQSGVQGGMSPPLIEPGRLTVAGFLKQQGYHTCAIGKWHLGMNWPLKPGAQPFNDNVEKGEDGWRVDFTRRIQNGPTSVGFNQFFGIAASLDMVPYTFIENDRVVTLPTTNRVFEMMLGRTNKLTRRGPGAEKFEAEEVLPTLTRKAVAYIRERAAEAKQGSPFFLYLPLNSPHTPIAPGAAWRGKSGLNPYADFVMETDWAVGEVLRVIEQSGVAGNTVLFFASDNGCSPEADMNQLRAKGHHPSYLFRGAKADIFEGGHHIPLIVSWPGHIPAATTTAQLVCLNDLFATCADILGAKLPANAAEDSVSLLPVLLGKAEIPVREALVHHSINGSFSIRQANWKLTLCPDSGGWSAPRPESPLAKQLPSTQLYDMSADGAETNNVAAAHPEVVERLTALLAYYVTEGRSTPGERQTNTVPVNFRKQASGKAGDKDKARN